MLDHLMKYHGWECKILLAQSPNHAVQLLIRSELSRFNLDCENGSAQFQSYPLNDQLLFL